MIFVHHRYTEFLTQSELHHAKEILDALLASLYGWPKVKVPKILSALFRRIAE